MSLFTKSEKKQLSDKEFLKELAEYAASQRALVEAAVDGFSVDPIESAVRVERAMNDFRYFAKTYFPHYVYLGSSVFHDYFYDHGCKLVDDPSIQAKEVIAAPRGEAKSTIITQLFKIFCIVTGRKKFSIVIMDSLEQAAMMLEAIKIELEFNPRLLMDFPQAAGRGDTWQVAKATTKNNALLVAAGTGKKLRGLKHGPHRPDIIFMDDIENDENVLNPDIRKKIADWIDKSILKLKGPGAKMDVFYVGTVLHYDSVLNRMLNHPRWNAHRFQAIIKWPDRMDLWEKWEEILINQGEPKSDIFYKKNKKQMDAGAVVSWPEARPILMLMKERSDNHAAFESELQNDPSDSENAIFKEVQFWVHSSNRWVFYGACDPSLGKKNKGRSGGDPSAILVGGWDSQKNRLDVVIADITRRKPNVIIQRVIDLQREYNCILWAFESVQFQEFCRTELINESINQGVPVSARGVIPNTDKMLRIESIEPYVTNGNIKIHQSQGVLKEQMIHFPQAKHDDGPDCLEMLWTLASRNAGGIPQILSAGNSSQYRGY